MPSRPLVLRVVVSFLVASAAFAQVGLFPDEVERVDVIAIERDGRELFAFDSLTGGRASLRLDVAEEVLFEASRGRVGVVLTDRRALGVTSGRDWAELRFQLDEAPERTVLVEDRLALLMSDRRVLAFNSDAGWVEEALSPSEVATAVRVGAAVGVVTTNRRALGIAPRLRGFATEALQVREELEAITAQDTLATIRTGRRLLVFSAPRGTWTVQKRPLR